MTSTACFPAADVATAATAMHARLLEQAEGPDGIRAVNHDALYRSEALARFAAAAARQPAGTVTLSADDFALIDEDLDKAGGVPGRLPSDPTTTPAPDA